MCDEGWTRACSDWRQALSDISANPAPRSDLFTLLPIIGHFQMDTTFDGAGDRDIGQRRDLGIHAQKEQDGRATLGSPGSQHPVKLGEPGSLPWCGMRSYYSGGGGTMQVNRAPVLTLWAVIVADQLGYKEASALTLRKALAGLNALSKGRALESSRRKRRRGLPRRAPAWRSSSSS